MVTFASYMKIGIGITTHNRTELLSYCLEKWHKQTPHNIEIVIVEDTESKGVSAAKNRCIQRLETCDIVMLADDDVFPLVANWHIPFIDAHTKYPQQQCFVWADGRHIPTNHYDGVTAYKGFQGCFMSLTRKAIETVGGWNEQFTYSHADFAYLNRLRNMGMMPLGNACINDVEKVLHALDFMRPHPSDLPYKFRSSVAKADKDLSFASCKDAYEVDKGMRYYYNYK